MVHVGLHSVGTCHKKFGCKNKKIKICFAECQKKTLGKQGFAECQPRDTRHRFSENPKSRLCRVPVRRHSANTSLSSARSGTLGKGSFAECRRGDTRQRLTYTSLPSATHGALDKAYFAECQPADTRQSIFLFFLFCQPNFLWYVPTLSF